MSVQTVINACSREHLASMEPESVHAVICDPPYEINFMSKKWDNTGIAFDPEFWAECYRVLKPGGHLIAFGACRTHHRIWCAIEDAKFEIRDTLQHLFGTGFPKSLDCSKALDRAAGAEREVLGTHPNPARNAPGGSSLNMSEAGMPTFATVTAPATPEAKHWDGWGTSLKPAWEPICLARKPLAGTVAANLLEHGVGGLNVDACRVGDEAMPVTASNGIMISDNTAMSGGNTGRVDMGTKPGRWPPNILLSDDAAAELGTQNEKAPRYFPTFKYQAKASRKEREAGCEGLPGKSGADAVERKEGSAGQANARAGAGRTAKQVKNYHPTVKPIELMRWICKLVTPKGGTILDPFTGSGTTGVAAKLEGFDFIGIERDPDYCEIARARIAHWGNE